MVCKKFNYILLLVILFSCENQPSLNYIEGNAIGTTYHIKYFSAKEFNAQKGIDSVFYVVNKSMSTYIPQSDISKINKGDTSVVVNKMFKETFHLSKEIHRNTNGYFEPTVGNLVNAYGFGAEKLNIALDSTTIDSLLQFVGIEKINITEEGKVIKENPGVYLEFNAIGKGYAVDRIAQYLENNGARNYLVEVGGELSARGINLEKNSPWRVGIDDPQQTEAERTISSVLVLKNRAMATSGNYRKFRIDSITGTKYVHTVNPNTGQASRSNLLSASVLAENCALADGYATAFMAMGLEESKKVLSTLPTVDAFFIYDENGETKTFATQGFLKVLED